MYKISIKSIRKFLALIFFVCVAFLVVSAFEIYIPVNPFSSETITYTIQKGESASQIAADLKNLGLIRSTSFFKLYLAASFRYPNLQAGEYSFSSRMSAHLIAQKIASGDIKKNIVRILPGWTEAQIKAQLAEQDVCSTSDFDLALADNWKSEFSFLSDKPKSADLEGYLFPDTYEFAVGESCDDVISTMLSNFGNKLTPAMRNQIAAEHKTIFQVITMASIVEKEVPTLSDKKIVAGILWKRILVGMPLQVDATVNYITGKNDPSVSAVDEQVTSPYNTYKNYGLPPGPISNPGLDSITAAINPTESPYFYFLSESNGTTIFSQTLAQQQAAEQKYLGK
jgi:UPF0755 protein